MPELLIQKGRHTLSMLYSEIDEYLVNSNTWRLDADFYVVGHVKIGGEKKTRKFHRLIMDVHDPNIWVDHLNGDILDNRRENLRICTPSENGRNKRLSNNKYGYKGVSYKEGIFQAGVKFKGRSIKRGYFKTAIEAARHYDSMALHYFKEFSCLNFPEEVPYDYLEWCAEADRKNKEIEDQQQIDRDRRDSVINDIFSKHGHFDTKLLEDFCRSAGVDYTLTLRTSYRQHLNKMIKAGILKKESIPIDVNNHMLRYFKVS